MVSGQKGRGHAVNKDVVAWNPTIREGDNYRRDRYSVGAEWKSGMYAPAKYKEARPASIRAEWLGGEDGEVGSRGGYVTTSIPVAGALDIVASGETFDRNTSVDGWDQTNLTVGLQYWFYKKCRVQLQYTRCLPPCSNWSTSTHRPFSFLLVKDPTHCMVSITDETWD